MVEVSIVGTKIHIRGDDPEELSNISSLIGSSHYDTHDLHLIRCKCSIPNLRRVKRIVPGAKLAKDDKTREKIAELLKAEDEWVNGNERLRAAKAGRNAANYEFKFVPYKHQKLGFNFMASAKCSAIFGDCGIGKTAIAASFLDHLVQLGEITRDNPALVVCPISIIRQAWLKDIQKFTGLNAVSIYEPSAYKTKEKRLSRLNTPAEIYIASYSLLLIMEEELRKKQFKLIIVDESTKIKNPESKTFRALKEIAAKTEYRYIMTGTPAPNGPLDLWSQFYFVDNGMTLEPSLVDFRHEHFRPIALNNSGAVMWVPRKGMTAKIYETITPRSIRFKASECLDLPEQVFSIRECEMGPEQTKAYNEMAESLFTVLENGETVTARIALSKLMKLREITGGFVIGDDGVPHPLPSNKKLEALDELLEQIIDEQNKAIVWIQYRWEAQTIIERYKKYGARGLYGDVSQKTKDENIDLFIGSDKCRVLVCHPQSAGHGLTLVSANYSIYYSLSHNFEEYYQSSKRIHRPGQTKTTFYYFLIASGTVDESLLRCIEDKRNVQDMLIDGKLDINSIIGIRKVDKQRGKK